MIFGKNMNNFKNLKVASVLLIFSFLSVGCSDSNENVYDDIGVEEVQSSDQSSVLDDAINKGNQRDKQNSNSSNQNTSQASQVRNQQTVNRAQSARNHVIADQNIQLSQDASGKKIYKQEAPKMPEIYYSPNQFEVTSALANVLTQSVIKMKEGEQRDKFYQDQVKLIQDLKINSCGRATLNNILECDILMGNKRIKLKMVYTPGGWFIVK